MLKLSQIMSPENDAETLQQKLEAEILKKKVIILLDKTEEHRVTFTTFVLHSYILAL